ncbi:MAG: hypothetical protein QW507_02270 [Candidatus Nanoarchaeia archaeon]|nr:hypothetical protein [Candidatus Haiyanarchaeum thermophilum]MCW1303244.1 hypothetical protein [Candidatus Haiyanarchaeum thermophilum]MCW1304024.1 hypothetical protein [Candidatus Haiyanarchaeum thermophilum]MCW1306404.1 hypothetical protein [Candidatus Haiyanarchaeum thermophilum]MCW1307298.1 hypothetical protein [Candidatus Haiyanarchaeum thermophilum]
MIYLFAVMLALLSLFLPAIHPNVLAALSPRFNGEEFVIFILSFSLLYHLLNPLRIMLMSYIDSDSELAYFPLQKEIRRKGITPIYLCTICSIYSILITLILSPLYIFILSTTYSKLKNWSIPFLLCIILFSIWKEKRKRYAILIYLLSGILGVFVLNFNPPLLSPMLFGFFTLPYLKLTQKVSFLGIKLKFKFQNTSQLKLLRICLKSSLTSILYALVPSLTSTQLSILWNPTKNDEKTLLNSAITASLPIFCLISAISIGKGRSGYMEEIKHLISPSNIPTLYLIILFTTLLSLFLIFLICFTIQHFPFISKLILPSKFILICFILWLYSLSSLPIIFLAFSISKLAEKLKVRKVHCMGCISLKAVIDSLR